MTQIRCEVKGVFVAMNDATTVPLVVLTDGGEQSLPIFIGLWEAVSINSAKNKEILSDLSRMIFFWIWLQNFPSPVHYLQIDSIEDGVYYAQLVLSADHHKEYLDCRPSDGIALALRADVPIFVDENVLASAGQKTVDLPPMVDLSTFLRK